MPIDEGRDRMTREIHIPTDIILKARIDSGLPSMCVLYPVCVDWPELRLTEEQVLANILAKLDGYPEPYPDHSIFAIRLDRFE